MSELKQQTIQGVKWSAIERFASQGIHFIIGIILARLLTPSDYGTIGMIAVFTAILTSFVDSGFSNALIRKIDRTNVDCSTVFYFNLAVSVVCYVIMFISAPWISKFFKTPILEDIIRVVCVSIIINALGAVQIAQFTWTVDFKSTARASIVSTIVSGIVGISMAYMGYGVWSLVWQTVTSSFVNVGMLWLLSKWRPLFVFSVKSFKELFSFGSKLLVSGLIHTIYTQLDTLLVGKFFQAKQLGLWSRAKHLVNFPSSNITGILGRVTYPILSKLQNDDVRLISAYRKYIKLASMIIFFLMLLLFSIAKPLVLLLLTEKWSDCVIYAQIICFTMMFDHINQININLLYVKGRSDLVLKLEILKKAISISILLVCLPFGLIYFAFGRVAYCQIAIIFNTYYTGKMFNFGYLQQLRDYMPYWSIAFFACLPSFLLCSLVSGNTVVLIFMSCIISALLYFGWLYLKKDNIFIEYIWNALNTHIRDKFKK